MNIIVIGLGSMGKRRIRLIHELYPEYTIIGVDSREDRRKEAQDTLGIQCFSSIEDVDVKIECAFVCTSPLSHSKVISICLDRGWNVFTELNLVADGYDENIRLAEQRKVKLFLSSSFCYREEIKNIKSRINMNDRWNYIYHIGQYLPDWHPWESYNDFFIGNKKTNGCREIMAIELPWLVETFGKIKSVDSCSDKMTDLHIQFNDNYFIRVDHESGCKGVIIVDVVSPVPVRRFEAYGENRYISWNGTPESLNALNPETKKLEPVVLSEQTERNMNYSSFIVENMYKNEIRDFFEYVINDKQPVYSFEKDKVILDVIDTIEG